MQTQSREREVAVFPKGCRACGSVNRSVIKEINDRRIRGRVNDETFNRVTWSQVKCDQCGRLRIERVHYAEETEG